MSVRIEWMSATSTQIEIIAPGEDWIGAEHQEPDQYVLAISGDECTAIEGDVDDLKALANRILDALPA